MLSPKMQRSVRVNEMQLTMLSDRAQYDHSMVSLIDFLYLIFLIMKYIVSTLRQLNTIR